MQQIEGVKYDAVGLLPQRGLKCLKVRNAMAVLRYGLTINDCRLAVEVGSGANNRGIAVAPSMSIAAEHPRLTALNHHLRAVAIVLDFVNPVLPLWWLIDRGSKRGSMNLREGKRDIRGTYRRSPDGACQGFFH